MKKTHVFILGILVFIAIWLCFSDNEDKTKRSLGNNYYWRWESRYHIKIQNWNRSSFKNRNTIYSKVVDYAFNGNYIIVKQELNELLAYDVIGETLGSVYYDRKRGDFLLDSIKNNDPYFIKMRKNKINYYIIVKAQDSIHGPFTKEEYLQEKAKLNVPENLKLKFETPK